jgi:hypothetical protein
MDSDDEEKKYSGAEGSSTVQVEGVSAKIQHVDSLLQEPVTPFNDSSLAANSV